MKKKLTALALVATMLIASSMTVFAEETAPSEPTGSREALGGGDLTMQSTVETVTISVTVTKGDAIVANPYGIEKKDGSDNVVIAEGTTFKGSTITFVNGSNVPIYVALTGRIKLPTYATSAPAAQKVTVAATKAAIAAATTKQVYVDAEVLGAGTDGNYTKELTSDGTKVVGKVAYGTTAKSIANVTLAAKDKATGDEVDKMQVKIDGATSVGQASLWNATTDKFDVITTYDLQLGGIRAKSKFKTAATTEPEAG